MPFSLEALRDEEYIAVRHQGNVTAHEVKDAHRCVLDKVTESGANRLLIDIRNAITMPSLAELYFLIGDAARRKRIGARTAIVTEVEQEATAKFMARVAAHHGTSIDVFENDEDALCWLADST